MFHVQRIRILSLLVALFSLPVNPAHARGDTASRACLTADTRAVLEAAEAHFGVTFKLVSTCRPHAVIAGTNHVSEHARGRAVDLLVPRGVAKRDVVRWFYAHARGVTMVYRTMPHVHFDTGRYHALACGGCGHRRVRLAHNKSDGDGRGRP